MFVLQNCQNAPILRLLRRLRLLVMTARITLYLWESRVRSKKAAFTLAEMLITLAIIGIVAALTIPTLIQNYQERAWNTASQVFQRKLGEALYQDASGNFSGNRNNDKALSMGFITPSTDSFALWSSEEYSKSNAYTRYFNSTYTHRGNYNRGSNNQAVCLAE